MSLPPASLDPIPEDTVRIAHAAFPQGSAAMTLRDRLGPLYHDGMFADLYPPAGQPALAPWRLALVTVLQFIENLGDRQAALMVQGRIDWKYALALPLAHPGFAHTALCTFRERIVAGSAEERLLWAVLEVARDQRLLRKRGRQRTDSARVVAAVRSLTRLELVGETLRAALEALAVAAPEWVREHVPLEWADRYGRRIEESRLPEGEAERQVLAQEMGRDGVWLLAAVQAAEAPSWLREVPAVRVLQQVWAQQYDLRGGEPQWRSTKELPAGSERIESPYDTEVRYGEKRGEGWVGGKAQLTERHDEDLPHLILHVASAAATVADQAMLLPVWEDLTVQDLLPSEQYVDTGYMAADNLVAAKQRGIELIGPLQADSSWQARAKLGYAAADFAVDWETQRVRCPQGQESRVWARTADGHGGEVIRVRFARETCAACPVRPRCTRSTTCGRSLTLLPTQEQYDARREALHRQETAAFRERYRRRAGVEGTISQAVRRTGMRQARYRGLAKLHLQHCAEAAAINVLRLVNWLDHRPRAGTRRSHLIRVLAPAA